MQVLIDRNKMRFTYSVFILIFLSFIHFQPSHSHLPPSFKGKLLGKGTQEKDAGGTALAAVITSRKLDRGLKAILFKPLLLVALAKIKFALLLGKPLVLLAIKKLLLKAVLGKLLLKIPLILLKGKALLVKMLTLKFALVTKGLLGLKAPLAMLFLGACALGSGLGLALALGATLHKLKEGSYEDYSYEEPYYPPPRPSYDPPSPPAYNSPYSYSLDPAHSSPAVSYSQNGRVISNGFGNDVTALTVGIGENSNFGTGYSGFGNVVNGFEDGNEGKREKRDYSHFIPSINNDEKNENGEGGDESYEESIEESPEDLQHEFEAARTNGIAYLYMAAQFDELSCGRRLMCEIYQKAHENLTEDEILLKEIFGFVITFFEIVKSKNKNS